MADQVGPPDAGGQVAGWQSAVGQVAGGAGGQGGAGAGCWLDQDEAGSPMPRLVGGDQGGKLCSMQLHGRHGRGKKEKGENKK